MNLLLLPGMDGTGLLFDPLLESRQIGCIPMSLHILRMNPSATRNCFLWSETLARLWEILWSWRNRFPGRWLSCWPRLSHPVLGNHPLRIVYPLSFISAV